MHVCACNALTDRAIADAVEAGAATAAQVYAALGCAPQCGKCLTVVRGIMLAVSEGSLEQPIMAAE